MTVPDRRVHGAAANSDEAYDWGTGPRPIELTESDRTVEFIRLPLAEADDPGFQQLLGWWQRTRGERAMPARAEIDPMALRELLPRLLILEVSRDPPDFRYRLAGTQTRDIHGIELTGRSVLDLIPRGQGRNVWNDCCEMLQRKQPQHILLRFTNREGLRRRYRVLRVPLSNAGREVDHVLTVQDFGRDPRTLGEMYREYRRGNDAPGT